MRVPTRLIYVVDRRTVVDQATDLAERLRCKFGKDKLSISTLRGQLADNREWSVDPSRPAIIIGTVDLIGSGLLFSGYRSSYKRRPLEASLLGQDSLLVLDEAHLSKPFEKLLVGERREDGTRVNGIEQFQSGHGAPMRIIRMSATSGSSADSKPPFALQFDVNGNLTGEDAKDATTRERFSAKKRLTAEVSTGVIDSIASAVGEIAAQHPGSRVVIFVKAPKDVDAVRKALIKKDQSRETKIAQLTGTMRGLERDELVTSPTHEDQYERRVMQRFLHPDNDPSQGECFLVSTSAVEVGFDLNADHLVGDAAPLDSWIQRLGRVNRRGNGDGTVILNKEKEPADKTDFDKACIATSKLLIDVMDVSPKALAAFKNSLTREQIDAASSPKPIMVELTDILLDAWSMTSIIEPMPGRPEVGPWLRGVADELPQITIAWRAELDEPGFADLDLDNIEEWFDTHRILTHETLSVPTSNKSEGSAEKWMKARWEQIGKTLGEEQRRIIGKRPAIIERAGFRVMQLVDLLAELDRGNSSSIRNADLILPASFGGIEQQVGLLDTSAPKRPEDAKDADSAAQRGNASQRQMAPDVADERGRYRELIIKPEDGEKVVTIVGSGSKPKNLKSHLRYAIELESDDYKRIQLVSFIPRREKPEYGSSGPESLAAHVTKVRNVVNAILNRLPISDDFQQAAQLAADFHDHGKNRERWQRTVGGEATPLGQDWRDSTLGKSGGAMKRDPRGYRHEFGSLYEFADAFHAGKLLDKAENPISEEVFDLAMHLIAAHHGRGRPHFPKGGFDPDCEPRSDEIHTETIRRFARLQRKYGWWHLAWLENLLRCADALASADADTEDDAEESNSEEL